MKKEILEELTIGEIKRFRKKAVETSIVLVVVAAIVFFILLALLLAYIDPFTDAFNKLQNL